LRAYRGFPRVTCLAPLIAVWTKVRVIPASLSTWQTSVNPVTVVRIKKAPIAPQRVCPNQLTCGQVVVASRVKPATKQIRRHQAGIRAVVAERFMKRLSEQQMIAHHLSSTQLCVRSLRTTQALSPQGRGAPGVAGSDTAVQ
jgi:hypothetical protein